MAHLLLRRGRKIPFRKQAVPFSQHLEKYLILKKKFFSTKLKKKENMWVTT